jgi:hypothetical protein
MPDWLIEGDVTVLTLLVLACVVLAALWWQSRKQVFGIAAIVIGLLALTMFLVDHLVESDREQIQRKVGEIAAAISNQNLDAAFAHVSSDFRRGGTDKAGFRKYADGRLRSGFVTDVSVWDMQVPQLDRAARQAMAETSFRVHGSFGATPPGAFARIGFVLDSDGQWRVRDFDWFTSIANSNSPMPIPGWGN